MSKVFESYAELVGNTPLLHAKRLSRALETVGEIYLKLEYLNPAGSVKDRVGMNLIDDAEKKGLLKKGSVIIEPTSGNTGIGLAAYAAVKGYRIILTMPESMSIERRKLLAAYSAEIVLTPACEGMSGAVKKANELALEIPGGYIPGQFVNPANAEAHEKTTAPEIFSALDGKIDYFVAGVGTGGTLTGCAHYFKGHGINTSVVAVEPFDSQVIAGKPAGAHKLQGIGANFVPEVLDRSVIDEIFPVKTEESFSLARALAVNEGILCGISSGAALYAAVQIAKRPESAGKNIVAILPDTGDRYLSTELFD